MAIGQIEEEPSRIVEKKQASFIMLPKSAVQNMVKHQKKIKNFLEPNFIFPYTVDVLVENYAIEINGPYHYFYDTAKNEYKENGITKLKKELVEFVGLQYVEVPFWDVDNYLMDIEDVEKRKKFIEIVKQKL